MKLIPAYTILISTLLSATAAPTPPQIPLSIIDEANQVRRYGQTIVDGLKEAARQSQINVEESIEVVKNPNTSENIIILRNAFGEQFYPHLGHIQQSLEKIKKGVLVVKDVNAVGMGIARADYNMNTKEARFGPLFHSARHHKAGIVLHERSHAFADTCDYFLKKDGRGLTREQMSKERKEDYWTGYAWSSDWPHIPSDMKVRNADSYTRLGALARRQHDVRNAMSIPQENPIIRIVDAQDQIKKHGDVAIYNLKKAAHQSNFHIEQAIRVALHNDKKENHEIMVRVFGNDYQPHLRKIRELLQRTRVGILIVGGINEDVHGVGPQPFGEYDHVIQESFFSKRFQNIGTSNEMRATVMQQHRAIAFAGAFEFFAKSDKRGLSSLEVKTMPKDTYVSGSELVASSYLLDSAARACNAESLADLGTRAAVQYHMFKGKPPPEKTPFKLSLPWKKNS